MKNSLEQLKNKALKEIRSSETHDSLLKLEKRYLGRKGEVTKVLRSLKDMTADERKTLGKFANKVKQELTESLEETKVSLQEIAGEVIKGDWLDVTLPSEKKLGHLHPLSQVQYELEDIFSSMGFMVLDGPELESEFYNFEALNIPKDHPARDMQDTFYINSKSENRNLSSKQKLVLRTHTSNLQVRAMQKYGAPLRAIFPGRVFRCEATDASHDTTFDQVEGLMIDENISIANFKAVVETFLSQIFNREVKTRLRPGYFPFVEPGFEVDLNCEICGGKGCRVCKNSGWVEFMGAGMVHPNVLKYGGINSKKYTGFAFGFGITRLVMMKYKISDIRLMLGGDLRF
ncbi:phenylalanine--tRNA ligase subunit alpha, partial [Candidatus Parcubacteria bacterium]|nr:phenylalanine--tRNA ligase subunit alpha [Candidatus Parcubacteria bacterium]